MTNGADKKVEVTVEEKNKRGPPLKGVTLNRAERRKSYRKFKNLVLKTRDEMLIFLTKQFVTGFYTKSPRQWVDIESASNEELIQIVRSQFGAQVKIVEDKDDDQCK